LKVRARQIAHHPGSRFRARVNRSLSDLRLPPAQPAKTTLFAGGSETSVRKTAAGRFSNRLPRKLVAQRRAAGHVRALIVHQRSFGVGSVALVVQLNGVLVPIPNDGHVMRPDGVALIARAPGDLDRSGIELQFLGSMH
jgi:hypothetical protein